MNDIAFKILSDTKGAYIDIIDDDNDYVVLLKKDDEYYYRVRGPVVDRLQALENLIYILEEENSAAKDQIDHITREGDELLSKIYHSKAMKRFLSKRRREGEYND